MPFKIILLIFFLASSISAQSAEAFLAASAQVSDTIVSRQTSFGFQLFLNTQTVQNSDYLLIILPTGVSFRTNSTPVCTVTSMSISQCVVLNSTAARINFTTTRSYSSIEGTISNFVNPDSVRVISNIEIDLYSGSTQALKVSTSSISLVNFQTATCTSAVSSSSTTVGATDIQLRISVTPATIFKAQGRIIVAIPQYYSNAGSTYMIGDTPTCSGIITGTTFSVSSCSFNQASQQLTIVYQFSSGSDISSALSLSISTFKNPISTQPKTGFQVFTQDSSGNPIETSSSITLSGITTPAAFQSNTLSLVDSTMVQSYTGIQIKLSLQVPLEQSCYVKFIFPSDFTIDDKLAQISGSGFFKPSATSSSISSISKDSTTRTVIIQACQIQYGPSQTGIITFSYIQNPPQVKTTAGIQIFLAKDSSFSINIAQITSSNSFVASSSLFTSGSISSISASMVDSNQIQTDTNYTIVFTPQNSLPSSNAVILITFPSWIILSKTGCSITAKSSSFSSSSIACSISGQFVTVTSPFSSGYTGGTQLSITVSKGTNPQSERPAGAFTIATYIQISGTNYIVDSGISSSSLIVPQGGGIFKFSDISVIDPITYSDDQTYYFQLQLQHSIPANGYLNFTIPEELSISTQSLVKSGCRRTDTNEKLDCSVANSTQILITLDSNGFSKSSIFQFKVSGLKNPRTTKTTGLFYFSSYDSDLMRIDSSKSNDYFTATVSQASTMTSFSVELADKTNSKLTNYTFSIVPNTPISQLDQIQIQFPTEVSLPDIGNLLCYPDDTQGLLIQVSCSKLSTNVLIVIFTKSNTINAGQVFSFIVGNIKNPLSTKSSSAFSNILMSTSIGGYLISQYTKTDVIVTTNISAVIPDAKLTQSHKNPSEEAIYTIVFTTPNVIPPDAAILITAPSIITVSTNTTACYLAMTQTVTDICQIDKNLIRIQKGFSSYTNNYFGEVSIIFKAINPGDNSNLQSIILRIYTDDTYSYRINKIETGLVPTLECNFPCRRCDQNNPDYCTDCFTQITFPQYIQPTISGQTCSYRCTSGYTSNGTKNPKVCQSCNSKCQDCFQNDKAGDTEKCDSCAVDFPYYYSSNTTCQRQCFDGQYQCKYKECCDCSAPCKTCFGPNNCKSCHLDSSNPLLWIDKCLSACPSGYTKVINECLKCSSPCATCSTGVTTSCLTCDMKQGKQLIFGRTCVSECPEGTTPQLSNSTQSRCVGCVTGCEQCDSDNNALCLRCVSGLALFQSTCYSECPFNYQKSRDGKSCEMRTYLLDSSLVYFPFAISAGACVIISIAAFVISKRKSMIISNAIAFLGVVEWACLIYQTYYAYKYEVNYDIITLACFSVFCGLILFNLFFLFFYCLRLQSSDVGFNYWRQKFFCTTLVVLLLSLIINFKVFRLVYSRFLGIERFSAAVDDKKAFAKRIQIVSIVSIFTFTLPLCIIDTLVLIYLEWGSQLYITAFESGSIALFGALLIILDNCCMCSRLSYQEERAIQKQKVKQREVYKQIDQSKSEILVNSGPPEDYIGMDDTRRQILTRKDALSGIVSQIKNNQRLGFNNPHLDNVFTENSEEEDNAIVPLRKTNSMIGLLIKVPEELKGSDDRQTKSYPGSPKTNKQNQQCNQTGIYNFNQENILKTSLNKRKYKQLQLASNIQQEFKFDNVYAEIHIPPPEPEPIVLPQYNECEIQTDTTIPPIKPTKATLARKSTQAKIIEDRQAQESLDNDESQDFLASRRNKRRKRQRGKSKNPYYTQINEEDQEEDQLSLGEEDTQREFLKTAYEQDEEDDQSDEQEDNEGNQQNRQSRKRLEQRQTSEVGDKTLMSDKSKHSLGGEMNKKPSDKTLLSRMSGINQSKLQIDLLSSQGELSARSIKKQKAQELKILEALQSQVEREYFNQRTFNINDIYGDFARDNKGKILNRKQQIADNGFKDMKGRSVNQKGYLIDEQIGYVMNKENLNLMFKREELQDNGEIPMPYKFERYNFNPHEIFGHFDYDKKSEKPIILKNKQGQLVDKHLRPVNQSGFLVDEQANIVDNQGRVRFVKEQLIGQEGDLPPMFNYKGKRFDIREIIGIFSKDPMTKQIVLNFDPHESNSQVDKNMRRVNAAGYLVDKMGNIVNNQNKIVFFKSQLQFNEPPKLFPFMTFDLSQIQGTLRFNDKSQPIFEKFSSNENGSVDLFDLDDRLINGSGYLIDQDQNIIDRFGNIVFKKDILEQDENKKATQIPKVFRSGAFQKQNDNHNHNDEQFFHQEEDQATNIFEQNLLSQQNDDSTPNLLSQDYKDPSQNQGNSRGQISVSNFLDQDAPFFQNHLLSHDDPIVDLEIRTSSMQQQINDQQQQDEQLMSEPEPLMDKIDKMEEKKKTKKRKQSAQQPKPPSKKRQGEKVMQAYQASRPVSSYLPQKYQQQRAQSQARQRLPPGHQTSSQFGDNPEFQYTSQLSHARDREPKYPHSISALNKTSQIQSQANIFKQNAISALGFTEDLSGTYQVPNIKKNHLMHSQKNDNSDDNSYSAYLEGEVDHQQFYHNNMILNQPSVSDATYIPANYNSMNNQSQRPKYPRHASQQNNQRRIRQNESMIEKLYENEVGKYIEQSDDEDPDGEEIFNQNFNIGKRQQERAGSRQSRRPRLKMYEVGQRLDSSMSSESQLSKKGPAYLNRTKQHLKKNDSRLKGLENIYLQELSAKNQKKGNQSMNRAINKQSQSALGSQKFGQLRDRFQSTGRDVSPLEERQDYQIGRHRMQDQEKEYYI